MKTRRTYNADKNPVAKSDIGAKGLMQVIPRFHLEKLASHSGELALLEPEIYSAKVVAEKARLDALR